MSTWSFLTASDKIGFFALIVSAAAIGFGINNSIEERAHRKLSVIPKIDFAFVDGSNESVTGIVINNTGLGPARIMNLELYVDNELVAEAYNDEQWKKTIKLISDSSQNVRFHSAMSDFYLLPGKSSPLLFQPNDKLTPETLAFLRVAASKLKFGICFCSLYNQCWSVVSPGLQKEPCESEYVQYRLLNKGPIAEALKGRRSIEPWEPH